MSNDGREEAGRLIADIRKSALSNAFLMFGGAAVSGVAVPVIAMALIGAIIYFPIGSGLEDSSLKIFANALGMTLGLMAIVSGVLFAGVVHSVYMRRWRPIIFTSIRGWYGSRFCTRFDGWPKLESMGVRQLQPPKHGGH